MTETEEDYTITISELENYARNVEQENAELKAQVSQLQVELQSALNLIRAYEVAADCVRAAVPVFPKLIKREGGHA